MYVGSLQASEALHTEALLIEVSDTDRFSGESGSVEFKLNVPFKQFVEEYISISSTATTYTVFDPFTTPANAPSEIEVELEAIYEQCYL